MSNQKYFSRSWAMLTRDKGWIKPILVMAAASLVPVVGGFGTKGYALEWARLTAWGVDATPKQKNADVGKCISTGARAFVVSLGWNVALGIASGIIRGVFSFLPGTFGKVVYGLVALVLAIIMSVAGVVILVAELRTAIYQSIGAGYRIDRVFELIKRDVGGFLRIFLINFLFGCAIFLITFMFIVLIVVMMMPFVMSMSNHYDQSVNFAMVAGIVMPIAAVCMIFGYLLSILSNGFTLVMVNALGLWMRQFNVPYWGRSEEPLPQDAGPWDGSTRYYTQQSMQDERVTQWQAPVQQPMREEQPTEWQTQESQPVQQQDSVQETTQPQVQQMPPVQQEQEQQQEVQPIVQQQPVQETEEPQPSVQQQPTQRIPERQQVEEPVEEKPVEEEPERAEDDSNGDAGSKADVLYDDLYDAIRENDRVEGDD